MGSLLDWSCRRQTLPFSPEKWEKRLGQKCDHCSYNLTHEKCLSLCKCYYFCHQTCFIANFQPDLTDEEVDVVCDTCEYHLDILLEAQYSFSPTFTLQKCAKIGLGFFLIFLSILMILFTVNSNLKTDVIFMLLYVQGLLLGLSIYYSILGIRSVLYLKKIVVKGVGSTKLQIQTSAFKDLQMETNEELTKDYLAFDSKKSRQ